MTETQSQKFCVTDFNKKKSRLMQKLLLAALEFLMWPVLLTGG